MHVCSIRMRCSNDDVARRWLDEIPRLHSVTIAVISCTCAEIRYDFRRDAQGWKVLEGEFGQLIATRISLTSGRSYTMESTT